MKTVRVASYTRVSTEEQKKGYSIETQESRMKGYCRSKTTDEEKWVIVGVYSDPGKSGRDIRDRPNYQRMMKDIGGWDVLVAADLSRVHRNQKNFGVMFEILNGLDKQFISLTEGFDTTTVMGRFAMDIIARIRQLESEVIGERAVQGHKASKERGYTTMRHKSKWLEEREEDGKRVLYPTAKALALYDNPVGLKEATRGRLRRLVRRWRATSPWILPPKKKT